MIDISRKFSTLRTAKAHSFVTMSAETIERILINTVPKGDPLTVAKVAAVQAGKRTHEIIPYCHPIPIDQIDVEFEIGSDRIDLTASVKAIARTGVEMEALTTAAVAALTLFDMLKMIDETMTIGPTILIEKRGGKSDFKEETSRPLNAAVLVMSDSIASGKKSDSSGREIVDRLQQFQIGISDYCIVPDDIDTIVTKISQYCDVDKLDLVVTTGGTGFSPRDRTPEAMSQLIEREIPGIPEALRSFGQQRTPYSMLSRGRSGLRGNTLIVNLPGSRKGVSESLDALLPGILHAFPMIWGEGSWKEGKKKK